MSLRNPARRRFISRILTVSALAPALARASQFDVPLTPRFVSGFVYDTRSTLAVDLADFARGIGAAVHGIQSDATALWEHYLLPRWRSTMAPLAGVTSEEVAFHLQVLGADAGLRQHYRRVLHSPRTVDGQLLVTWILHPRNMESIDNPLTLRIKQC